MNKFHYEKEELKPKRSTEYSAGYDFFSPLEFMVPAHGVSETIDTEVSVELDPDKVLLCFVRSSFGFKYGITLVNGTGIIDRDFFPNTIKCKLRNDSNMALIVKKGDKFMQGIIMNYYPVDDEEKVTIKRVDGIGSTGK